MRLTKRNYDQAVESAGNAEASARQLMELVQSLYVKASMNRRQDPVAYLVLGGLAGHLGDIIEYAKAARTALGAADQPEAEHD